MFNGLGLLYVVVMLVFIGVSIKIIIKMWRDL